MKKVGDSLKNLGKRSSVADEATEKSKEYVKLGSKLKKLKNC